MANLHGLHAQVSQPSPVLPLRQPWSPPRPRRSQRLRIAFVADTLLAPIGGGVVAARNVVERLRQRHDVVVVGADVQDPRDVRLRGFQLPLRSMRESHFVMARPDRHALAEVLAKSDVVHLQFPFWLSFVAMEEAHRRGLPVVAGFHVQPENALHNVGFHSSVMNRALYRFWVERFYDEADAVICPSRFAERKLHEHGLRAPTYVVSNGVPPDLDPFDARLEPSARPRDGRFRVLMVGRFAAEKRQDVLIEAVRRSRHAHAIDLVIAGAGPLEQELRRRADGLPNGAEVGLLPRERLLATFRDADLFVHCSEVELEGIAVLEAMAMGLPALVAQSPESAASELALDERFRFPAGDPDALAARIDALVEAPEALAQARAEYRAKTRPLDFAACVDRLVEVYRTLVG